MNSSTIEFVSLTAQRGDFFFLTESQVTQAKITAWWSEDQVARRLRLHQFFSLEINRVVGFTVDVETDL